MDHHKNFLLPVQRAIIPDGEVLEAEIFGVDDCSYFHLSFIDTGVQGLYKEMLEKMRNCVRGRYCMPISLAMQPGRECIVEYCGRRGGIYVRGKIIELVHGTDFIRCDLIDDLLEVTVHRTQIYHTNDTIMDYPKFTLKCKLKNMACFLGHPYLKLLYIESMKEKWKPGSHQCTVKVIDPDSPIPIVDLKTDSGKNLSDILQQYIPTFQRPEYPKFGVPTRVKISHCDGKGRVWFQLWDEISLMDVIKSRLMMYNEGILIVKPEKIAFTPAETSWKELFLRGPSEIFIYKRFDDRKSYRVRELDRYENGTAKVFYVDYGNIEIVREDRIVPARLVDLNLCLIPPQCLPVKFIGAACHDDDIDAFNLRRFWKYALAQPVSVVLKEFSISSWSPDFLHLDRLIDADLSDSSSMNLSPRPCVPARVLSGGLGNTNRQFGIESFRINAMNRPVPLVLQTYDFQLNQKEKFQRRLVPPEADILVNLDRSLHPLDQQGVSLFEIYHTREYCSLHRPAPLWGKWMTDPSPANTSSNSTSYLEKQMEGLEIDNGAGNSTGLMESNEENSNWVDWALTVFGTEERDTISSLATKSETSLSPQFCRDENNNWWTSPETAWKRSESNAIKELS